MNTQSIILLACLLVIAGYAVYNTFFRKRDGKGDCDGHCSGGCGGCCGELLFHKHLAQHILIQTAFSDRRVAVNYGKGIPASVASVGIAAKA